MTLPISFGIELEFNLVYIPSLSPLPSHTTTTPPCMRTLHFPALSSEKDDSNPSRSQYARRAHYHIASLLSSSGLPVNLKNPGETSMHVWQITDDVTIKAPRPGDPGFLSSPETYKYLPIEVKSPALEFNDESLSIVRKVCRLLRKNYIVSTNKTCGLHIHIGHFKVREPFPLYFLKQLIPFLYVFEPQISSLHPEHRSNHEWGSSMRDTCLQTQLWQRKYGSRPSVLNMVCQFRACKTVDELLSAASDPAVIKANNVNFNGARKAFEEEQLKADGEGHTIEFRQHAGTLDGKAITMWIRVLAGIVRFLEEVTPSSFDGLLGTVAENEKWEKEGDGKDDEREGELGPVLADGRFTIIHLLEYMGLTKEASYYEDKCWIHDRTERRVKYKQDPEMKWEFMEIYPEDSELYKSYMIRKKLWDQMRLVDDIMGKEHDTRFPMLDQDSDFWPKHSWMESKSGEWE